MDGVAICERQAPLVIETSEETYGKMLWKFPTYTGILSFMDGGIHQWNAAGRQRTHSRLVLHCSISILVSRPPLLRVSLGTNSPGLTSPESEAT